MQVEIRDKWLGILQCSMQARMRDIVDLCSLKIIGGYRFVEAVETMPSLQ